MSDVRTLRPGLLVSMKTSIGGGNVQYERRDLENNAVDENGAQRSVWETARIVVDPAELAEATKVRGKVRWLVASVCTATSFGLLCPTDREDDLKRAVVEGRQLAWEFNQTAQHTQISVNVIYGRVAQDDVEAVQAISAELRDLVSTMEQGAAELNVKKIRDAAQKMRDTGQMLSPDVKLKVDEIVTTARRAARKIAKAGEAAAEAVDDETMAKLRAARTAFLDLDDIDTDDADAKAAQDAARAAQARAVDFDAFDDWGSDPIDDDDAQGAAAASAAPATKPAIDMDLLDDDTEGETTNA